MSAGRHMVRELAAGAARRAGDDLIYRHVLDSMTGGVMSIAPDGVITSFNRAASEICGVAAEDVVGRTFAEIFSRTEGMDEFADVIFNAVHDSSMAHQRVVTATISGRMRSLSMATDYLSEEREGETVKLGVVVVFNDISEIRELREKELRLAQELETKHGELRDAYRDLEDKNRALSTALKKVNAARVGAGIFVLALFLAIGHYLWNAGPMTTTVGGVAAGTARAGPGGDLRTVVVEPRPVSSTLTLVGRLAPRREIEVTSPIRGKVAAVHVRPGERVARGQRLLEMDMNEVRIDHRAAQVDHIKALDRMRELENWSDHPDVSRARRTLSKSRTALETRRNKLAETTLLLERGIIPASEHEAAEREHGNQLLDLQAAEEELQAILAKGAAEREVAQLELDNARARLKGVEETLSRATVTAPAAGVVLRPRSQGGEKTGSGDADDYLAPGASVDQGSLLLTIGDLDGVTVVGRVDEVDVVRVRPGHPVVVTGDAFPDIELRGAVVRVSSQASNDGAKRGPPAFEVAAAVESLTEDQRRVLRLGMSATLKIVVYDKADALLVPIGAVVLGGDGPRLRVRDRESGEVRSVEVATGLTTVDSVEIVEGIAAGDEVVVSR